MLTILDALPPGLLQCEADQLHEVLTGPTLIHLSGAREPPLFVSILLHGNEDTSWLAMRQLLLRYQQRSLPRAISLFIGNVAAARYAMRHLPDQPDYNRIWQPGSSDEHQMTQAVIQEMKRRGVFASIDIHNNTGRNPHYGCVNRIDDPRFLHLAALFSKQAVYFTKPDTVQSMAFAQLCPAVALECGKVGSNAGVEHALTYLETLLQLDTLPTTPVTDLDLFHTEAVVKIPHDITFGFGDTHQDLCFLPDLDRFNFQELPVQTLLGWTRPQSQARLACWDTQGNEVSAKYFSFTDGEIRTLVPFMPSMLTLNSQVIRQDCLCYLMERWLV